MNRNRYPVAVMCQFFGVSRSGYYDYLKRLDRPAHDVVLAEIIRDQQGKCNKTYGYRRMWKWLQTTKKIYRNPKTILRIMKKYELLSEIRRRRKWRQLGQQIHNAADTQALLHLYQNYCQHHECINCEVGYKIFQDRQLKLF